MGTVTVGLTEFLDFALVELDVVDREPAELNVLLDIDPAELSVFTEHGRLFSSLDAAESQLDWLETSLIFLFLDSLIAGPEPHESIDVSRSDEGGEGVFSTVSDDLWVLQIGLDLLPEVLGVGGLGERVDEAREELLEVLTSRLFLLTRVLLRVIDPVSLEFLLGLCN